MSYQTKWWSMIYNDNTTFIFSKIMCTLAKYQRERKLYIYIKFVLLFKTKQTFCCRESNIITINYTKYNNKSTIYSTWLEIASAIPIFTHIYIRPKIIIKGPLEGSKTWLWNYFFICFCFCLNLTFLTLS